MPFLNDEEFFRKFSLAPGDILDFAAPGDFLCYYSGSINEGRGSATSDVDVVIIADPAEIERRVKERRYRVANSGRTAFLVDEFRGAPVEVAVFLEQDITEMIERLDALDFADPGMFVNTRPLSSHLGVESVQSILHRLSVAKPLHRRTAFETLQQRLCVKRLCLWQARMRVARLNHLYEDLSGRLEIGEPESAFFLAREALMSLATIYANYLGASVDRTKWWKQAFDSVSHRIPATQDTILHALYRDCSSPAARCTVLDDCLNLIDEFHHQESALETALLGETR
ncbi:hypothetical protein [Xanthomonas graminis]|uniref:Polymerase nucleotidyl transferase domain-containing protein n=1 Tax=Xanthomonas graminis pv. poae TaxID=227946 RepID=A0A199NXE7_9XANT|nr:hypothetical protein [Xanthomonas translucens]OAX53475.1 hypothetical protein A6R73_07110 [Xanthomonas translucens pv. poae]